MKFRILLIFCLPLLITANQCLEYRNGSCLRCSPKARLVDNSCLTFIPGCIIYNKNECTKCDETVSQINGTTCVLFNNISFVNNTLADMASQYGGQNYQHLSLETCSTNKYFATCHNYMINGEYGHFISRTKTPYVFAGMVTNSASYSFKILYQASGGGLFLCIIDIQINNFSISLRSFVTISSNQIVNNCQDYSQAGSCISCQQDYHLQEGMCYYNLGDCISFYKNICLQCDGYSILIQNRCVTTCLGMCDANKVRFYESVKQPRIIPLG